MPHGHLSAAAAAHGARTRLGDPTLSVCCPDALAGTVACTLNADFQFVSIRTRRLRAPDLASASSHQGKNDNVDDMMMFSSKIENACSKCPRTVTIRKHGSGSAGRDGATPVLCSSLHQVHVVLLSTRSALADGR